MALLVVLLPLYFLPSIITAAKHSHDFGFIFIVNLVLGWVPAMWFVLLVCAFCAKRPEPRLMVSIRPRQPRPRRSRRFYA